MLSTLWWLVLDLCRSRPGRLRGDYYVTVALSATWTDNNNERDDNDDGNDDDDKRDTAAPTRTCTYDVVRYLQDQHPDAQVRVFLSDSAADSATNSAFNFSADFFHGLFCAQLRGQFALSPACALFGMGDGGALAGLRWR